MIKPWYEHVFVFIYILSFFMFTHLGVILVDGTISGKLNAVNE